MTDVYVYYTTLKLSILSAGEHMLKKSNAGCLRVDFCVLAPGYRVVKCTSLRVWSLFTFIVL